MIAYFSATGNTSRAVSIVGEALEAAGQSVDRLVIAKDSPSPADLAAYDRVIVAFPVLAMDAPVFVGRFLRSLPRGRRSDGAAIEAAVLAVSGGGAGTAGHRIAAILARKGFDVCVIAEARYAENWVQVGLVPKTTEEAEQKTKEGDAEALEFAGHLVSGTRFTKTVSRAERLLGAVMRPAFGLIGRRFFGKLFYADASCTGCGLCVKTCPASVISRRNARGARPYWSASCENCDRCMNLCPSASINSSILRGVLILTAIVAFSVVGIAAWTAAKILFTASIGNGLAGLLDIAAILIMIAAAHILALGPFDLLVLRPLSRLRFLDKWFAATFSASFRRYKAPGFNPTEAPGP